jgi:hypothetical protein
MGGSSQPTPTRILERIAMSRNSHEARDGPTLDDILGKPAAPSGGTAQPSLRRLNVGSTGSARGRKAAPLFAEITRELEAGDLAQLETQIGVNPQPLQRVRDTHHKLARTLAEGYTNVEASALTGFSPSRISILAQDPAFKELVAFYRARVDASHADVIERMKHVSMDALTEIQDRLHESPESFKVGELLEIMSRGFDRSGYGPSSTVNHQGEVLHSHDIQKIMQEAEELQNVRTRNQSPGQIIEGSAREAKESYETSDSGYLAKPATGQRTQSAANDGECATTEVPDDPRSGVGDAQRERPAGHPRTEET